MAPTVSASALYDAALVMNCFASPAIRVEPPYPLTFLFGTWRLRGLTRDRRRIRTVKYPLTVRIAVLGATGMIGSAYLTRAVADGHDVSALVRDAAFLEPAPRLTLVVGDARDPEAVQRVVARSEAVVSAVGPRANTPDAVGLLETTAGNVIAAMRTEGVSRVIFVAGAGVALPGERRSLGQRAISALVRRLARWVVASKERELALYLESGLDWTAIRPPRVVEGPPSGRMRLAPDRPGLRVTSGDVASAIAAAIADPTTVRKAPYVAS